MRTPSGASFEYQVSPKSEWNCRVTVRENDVRSECIGSDGVVREVLARLGDTWTQYAPAVNMAWIRRHGQMPHVLPVNPQEMWSLQINSDLVQILRRHEVEDVESLPDHPEGALVVIRTRPPKGLSATYCLAPARGFMPVLVASHYPDGTCNHRIRLSYQKVPERSAWLLKHAEAEIFAPGKANLFDNEVESLESLRTEVKRYRLLDEAGDSRFLVHLPEGVDIRDSTRRPARAENE